ncbi:MAG: DMT family transporter [Betaproteobacteria bacterium]|nr:DMT family transporter [Betaproteobacteria bacterium]
MTRPSEAGPARSNRQGIRLMVLAMACFIVNDTLVKFVSQSLPAGQLIFMRGLMATALVLAFMRATGTPVPGRRLFGGWVAVRATLDAAATLTYLVSLFNLPLANATAINMATPLVITLIAVLWLGHRVGAAHRLAIGLGFAGVLLVIQPRADGFNAFAWLCLAGTVLHALRDLVTLRIPREVPSIVATLATAVAVTVLAALVSLAEGWRAPTLSQLGWLAAAAVFLASGYQLIIRATRSGDISVIAPFRYSGLVMAVALGWAVWGDVPNALAWAGIALVLGSGLYLLRHESARRPAGAAAGQAAE